MDIFLKGLPSYNVENFARFQVDHNSKNSTAKRPPTFTSSKDHPKEQVIVTETHRNLVELIARISNKKRSIIRSTDTDEEEDRGRPCKIARVENVNSFHKD